MNKPDGCLKNGCLGCLGLLVVIIVFVGVNALLVVNQSGDELIQDTVLASTTSEATDPLTKSRLAPSAEDKPRAGHGWLVLELAQGEFQVHPGEPGSGIVVKANYDAATYKLEEYSHTWADSAWVYHVRFGRTISGIQALLREVMGGGHAARLHIYIAPDLPVELNALVKEGGLEMDLGGLWLTDLDLRYNKGGIVLTVDEPLREPLESLSINGIMGGGEVMGLGNASPRVLDIGCRMGGMELDLSGEWSRDCEANLRVSMGGMAVYIPDNLELESEPGSGLRRTDTETTLPVLRLHQQAKMGEIEIDVR